MVTNRTSKSFRYTQHFASITIWGIYNRDLRISSQKQLKDIFEKHLNFTCIKNGEVKLLSSRVLAAHFVPFP